MFPNGEQSLPKHYQQQIFQSAEFYYYRKFFLKLNEGPVTNPRLLGTIQGIYLWVGYSWNFVHGNQQSCHLFFQQILHLNAHGGDNPNDRHLVVTTTVLAEHHQFS